MTEPEPMTGPELAQYKLGRDAHQHGYPDTACPLPMHSAKRAFWLAGWIDEDLEAGNRRYFDDNRRRVCAEQQ